MLSQSQVSQMLVCVQISWRSYYNADSDWARLGGDRRLCVAITIPEDDRLLVVGHVLSSNTREQSHSRYFLPLPYQLFSKENAAKVLICIDTHTKTLEKQSIMAQVKYSQLEISNQNHDVQTRAASGNIHSIEALCGF